MKSRKDKPIPGKETGTREVTEGREEHDYSRTSVPEGFTLSMAAMDALPVIFFCCSAALISFRFPVLLFRVGVILVIAAGAMKVLWKFVLALRGRNVRFLNRQFRYLMPTGFGLMLLALIVYRNDWSLRNVIGSIVSLPAAVFYAGGLLGIILMCIFAVKLDRNDAHANWIEQGTNSLAQLFILLGILFSSSFH